MLRNYFKIALRAMCKQKVYSTIMIGGFSVGIAACLLIALYIRDELSYDRHIPNAERIYRIYAEFDLQGKTRKTAFFPPPLARVLEQDYPEVERAGHINPLKLFGAGSNYVRQVDSNSSSFEDGFAWADQGIVDLLQIPIVEGEAAHVLDKPGTILISQSMARKLFGSEDPMGKGLMLNNDTKRQYTVSGVMKDFPRRSHLQYHFFISLVGDPIYPGEQSFWTNSNYFTYVLLRSGADVTQLEAKLKRVVLEYLAPSFQKNGFFIGQDFEKLITYRLQPLQDIYLKSSGISDQLSHGDMRFIWMFGAIGAIILLIACINFINLSTARSANRAKEVGLRKVVGSDRLSLIRQFLTESLLFSFVSFALGIILTELLLPYFNGLTGKQLVFPWSEWSVIPLLVASAIIVGILAGIFPAVYLSSFRPVNVLKGDVSRGTRSSGLRSGLVVFQFSTCILLIIGTLVVHRQLDYILNAKLGFEKEQVLIVQGTNILGDQVQSFKDEVSRLAGVEAASVGDYLPVDSGTRNGNMFWLADHSKDESQFSVQRWRVDTDYVRTLGMNIVEGRDFSSEVPDDFGSIIINQSLAEKMQMTDSIGRQITNGQNTWTVVGVVEDFHYDSLKQEIMPLCLVLGDSPTMMTVKVNTADVSGLIASISGIWDSFSPSQSIRYTFLDENYARMYDDVDQMGSLLATFSLLAILVACLGLYALSAFLTEQRSKEISIRRVVGASLSSIFGLLTLSYVRLVVVAFGIAAPFGWYLMQRWLNGFAYRIDITWDVFFFAGLIALLIAVATVSYQSLKAGQNDPAKGLRTE